jgi:uncharacterized protein YjbJ (UPF0337 family)
MIKREEILGHWNEVKGRLQEHWGELTEDELQRAKGSTEQLVGMVQQKTGATRREIENFLEDIFGGDIGERLSEQTQHYSQAAQQAAHETADFVKENYRRAAQCSGDYANRVTEAVRTRPMESMAIMFGLGIAAGALMFFSRRQ